MVEKNVFDCLLVHVPMEDNYYKPIDRFASCMTMALGLFAIADLTVRRGYKTQIFHLGIEKIANPNFCIGEYIKVVKPKVVGLSLHWYLQSYDVIEAARRIKIADPEVFIVLGGLTASYFAQEIMTEFAFIDGVIQGDGELPFVRLLEEVFNHNQDLSRVPNLTWKRGSELVINDINYVATSHDLNELNFTNFRLLKNYKLYIKYIKRQGFWLKRLRPGINMVLLGGSESLLSLAISRGCILDCTFCPQSKSSQMLLSGRRHMALRSINKIIESIREAQSYGYNTFEFEYLPLVYFERLFRRIKSEKINISAQIQSQVLLSKSAVYQFKAAFPGRFSRIRYYMVPSEERRKDDMGSHFFDNSQLEDILDFHRALKIRTSIFFKVDILSVKSELEIIRQMKCKLQNKYISIMPPDKYVRWPGTLAYETLKQYGLKNKKRQLVDSFYNHKNLNKSYFLYASVQEICDKDTDLQRLICHNFCRLGYSFPMLFNLPLPQKDFLFRIFNYSGKTLCRLLSIYWKINCLFNPENSLKALGEKGKQI